MGLALGKRWPTGTSDRTRRSPASRSVCTDSKKLTGSGHPVNKRYRDWDCFNNTLGAGRIHVINPGGFLGYYSGNRTAANATAIYLANSSTPHYVAASAATSGGSPGARVLTAFVLNSSSGLAGYSRQRLSFIAAHSGLTESESAVFNGLIYKMRHDIGGGYV